MCPDRASDEKLEETEERLRALVAECEARLTEVADLVAHVRHEINNPLTGVLGQAQLLLREELSPTARKRVETIEQLAARIRDVVAQLRDVQRPQKQERRMKAEGRANHRSAFLSSFRLHPSSLLFRTRLPHWRS